jgi:hypothetical protein
MVGACGIIGLERRGNKTLFEKTFEAFNKNMLSADVTLGRDESGKISSKTFSFPNGNEIVVNFGRDESGRIETISLSGDLPSGVATVKTIHRTYDETLGREVISGISYL